MTGIEIVVAILACGVIVAVLAGALAGVEDRSATAPDDVARDLSIAAQSVDDAYVRARHAMNAAAGQDWRNLID